MRIRIFHTNDMHAHIEGMARLSTYARRLRSESQVDGWRTFFWDAGDAVDRREEICRLTKGSGFAPILNAMGYNLQTVGNTISLPFGTQALGPYSARLNFPLLAANLRDGGGRLVEGVQVYDTLLLGENLIMGVIGLTTPWGQGSESHGLQPLEYVDVAQEMVWELRGLGAKLIVVLSHLGLVDDRRLAQSVPGIDLIIGGHSHHCLKQGVLHDGVFIAQAGEFARCLGQVDLEVEAASGEITHCSCIVHTIPDNIKPDAAFLEAVEDVRCNRVAVGQARGQV